MLRHLLLLLPILFVSCKENSKEIVTEIDDAQSSANLYSEKFKLNQLTSIWKNYE